MLQIIFAGNTKFSGIIFKNIIKLGYKIQTILTKSDKKFGRGMFLKTSFVKKLAINYKIEFIQPRSLNLEGKYKHDALYSYNSINKNKPDILIIVAYCLILPKWLIDCTKYGCINIHASILPRWRGAAPIQRTLESGDKKTGITLIDIDSNLDTGNILNINLIKISKIETNILLFKRLANLGSLEICKLLLNLSSKKIESFNQSKIGILYANKINKKDIDINFSKPSKLLEFFIKALHNNYNFNMKLPGIIGKIKIVKVESINNFKYKKELSGNILFFNNSGIYVNCKKGILRILKVKRPGKYSQIIKNFIHGLKIDKLNDFV